MSGPRSHPSKSFPWDEPGFDPQKIVANLEKMPMGYGDADFWREEHYPGRRHEFQQHRHHSEETDHRRRPSPHHEPAHYEERGEGPKHREAYRENTGRYEDRRGGPPQPEHNRNNPQKDPGWRRDQPEKQFRERHRDRSPIRQERNQQRGRGTAKQGRKSVNIDVWTPGEDKTDLNRNREMDGSPHLGYGWEKPHEKHFSADVRRDDYDRKPREPLEFEHNRSDPMDDRPPPRREQYSHSRERDFPPPQYSHSRERDFPPPRPRNSRSASREESRGGHFVETAVMIITSQAGIRILKKGHTRKGQTEEDHQTGVKVLTEEVVLIAVGEEEEHITTVRRNRENTKRSKRTQRSNFREEEYYDELEPEWREQEQDQAWRDEDRETKDRTSK
ncbi:hypothetical protein WMY93_031894 [Mugilogobius chulae]|uniref:Btz domain-containing protein n=1 Tax=Mugilogobius chulae TaxID=88201 RepID=A0AAW0MF41_9GOBI